MVDVVVIGGANMDVKAKSAIVKKLGTSNPGTVTVTPGGVGRNIAHNLARLGAKVALISVVGNDLHGVALVEATRNAGVDVSHVKTDAPATGSYIVMLDSDGEMLTAVNDMRAVEHITPQLIEANVAMISAARYVVADCNLPIETLQAVAALAADRLVIEPVSVPKSRKLKTLLQTSPVFLATPNMDQLEELCGSGSIDEVAAQLHKMGLRNVVMHAGAEGAFISGNGIEDHVPPQLAGPIVDVTGAGDAAVAGLVFGLLQGKSLLEAAALGQKMAGIVIGRDASTLE
jgi:pseudouridine kinase